MFERNGNRDSQNAQGLRYKFYVHALQKGFLGENVGNVLSQLEQPRNNATYGSSQVDVDNIDDVFDAVSHLVESIRKEFVPSVEPYQGIEKVLRKSSQNKRLD